MAAKTENYRKQHKEIGEILKKIEQMLMVSRIEADAEPVATIMRELGGKISVHLAIEDSALYPRLIALSDIRIRSTAMRFKQEMGSLKTSFDDFRMRWAGSTAISLQPKQFIEETNAILTALHHRLEREETELYDIYDQVT
ncbi:hemerythrin domain-containing protein [Telmatospirillum siberiense]|uniref:Hemerythrin-like domain-containing protein n=1 Tax=Telmatospirillum siberiense TaxID=382514 RepID=A0A2N3PVH4_9PROT|nr:hemerythrin domain-containing protein [Telmatospirillum siberiense]PKU24404.1 hypothetical protein CWS72_11165 [Telmatospirillum siberiense]